MAIQFSKAAIAKTSFLSKATSTSVQSNITPAYKMGTPISVEDQQNLIEYARKGNEEAAATPSMQAARSLDPDPGYRFGFDVAIGLCKGMWLPGPGQDRIRNLISGNRQFTLPNGATVSGGPSYEKGFNVGQSLQHGITKARNDLDTMAAASAGADQAAGAYIAAGLAGSGLSADQKAETMSAVLNNSAATQGAKEVAEKKVGIIGRILAWFGL